MEHEHQTHPHVHTEHVQTENEPKEIAKPKSINPIYALPAAILVGAILISASIFYNTKVLLTKLDGSSLASAQGTGQNVIAGNNQPTAPAAPAPSQSADISKVKTDGDPFIGNANAPVTVAYWFDYQCPFCKRFEETVMPDLMSKYINSGKVKFVYKDFQFLGQDSTNAGLASHAVWEVAPSKFYEWHKAMYNKQDNENGGWGSKDDIIALTKTIPGIDANKVSQLMESKKAEYQKAMDADKAEGSGFGVSGTPSLIVGKQLVVGAQPTTAFTTIIDQLLK